MNKQMKVLSLGLSLVGVALLVPNAAFSKATGSCVECHTMHNSQNGEPLSGNPTPNGSLTNKNGCIGCHTGNNSVGGNIPFVWSTGAPTYGVNTLAGGNFYWVNFPSTDSKGGPVTADSRGHNVFGVSAAQDAALGFDPPGFNPVFNANTRLNGGSGAWSSQLTCAGTRGCHGVHEINGSPADDFTAISGSHHADDSVINGSTTAKSFRFLYGIIGKEDPAWEYPQNLDQSHHNQYFGVDRTNDTPPAQGTDGAKSINYLCAECHGNFHSGDTGTDGAGNGFEAGSAWVRHPSDYDMNNLGHDTEYHGYGSDGTYQPLVPLSTDRYTAGVVTVTVTNVFANSGDAIINCISCHRAHGSPYKDLLRWDFSTCEAGINNDQCGCFVCHTTKDAG